MKIISGGQTGVDRVALEVAHKLGFETGGWAPKGYRTDAGPDLNLGIQFGLKEHKSRDYPPRTKANVALADVTIWFGFRSPGYKCTREACFLHRKTFMVNPTISDLLAYLREFKPGIINVAGNRARTYPKASEMAQQVLTVVLSELKAS